MASMTDTEAREPRTDTNSPPDDDELAELMNPDTWDWDNVLVGVPAPNPTLTIGIRLEGDDVRILSAAARAANMPLSRYIKQVALEAATRTQNTASGHDTKRGAA
jgi:hypothetical protein